VGNNTGLYALTDEHEAIREAVRDIAEREIAPFAAEVDADSRYPIEAQSTRATSSITMQVAIASAPSPP
jgi:alkylation response protein AidB-like acyl-CoA dehydrogenase